MKLRVVMADRTLALERKRHETLGASSSAVWLWTTLPTGALFTPNEGGAADSLRRITLTGDTRFQMTGR
jgi:hypothetical protein